MRITSFEIRFLVLGFSLAFGVVAYLSWMAPNAAPDTSIQGESPEPAGAKADVPEFTLDRSFLSKGEWDTFLASLSNDALGGLIDAQTSDFWKANPLGSSAAYRLFGKLGRSDPALALERAIRIFTRAEVGLESGRNCLRWAALGIAESHDSIDLEAALVQCPREYWSDLIRGVIGGNRSGSLAGDFQSLSELVTRLLPLDNSKESNLVLHDILRSVAEAWVERNPAAASAWLQGKEGKRYRDLLTKAIAIASLGGGDEIAAQAVDKKNGFSMDAAAGALYQNGTAADAVGAFAAKLPDGIRKEFLTAYGRELAAGSPFVLQEFVEAVDVRFLIPELAQSVAGSILNYAPLPFEKLTSQMAPNERNKLLENRFRAQNEESSILYLKYIGADGANGSTALWAVAGKKLDKALSFVNSAPESQQEKLRHKVYESHVSHLVESGASLDELFAFAKSAPAESTSSISKSVISALAEKDLPQCLDALERFYPDDASMWSTAFGGAGDQFVPNLNPEQMSDVLQQKIEKGISPKVYTAAAEAMTAAFARENTERALYAVEALKDDGVKAACTAVLVRTWATSDPLSAAAYVGQLPPGEGRDSAIASVLPRLNFDSSRHEQLLSLISSEQVRNALRAQAEVLQKNR